MDAFVKYIYNESNKELSSGLHAIAITAKSQKEWEET